MSGPDALTIEVPEARPEIGRAVGRDGPLGVQAVRYARRKRQTISEVLRDGLQVWLSDQDPWHPLAADTHRGAT
jgi:hypothetical protein